MLEPMFTVAGINARIDGFTCSKEKRMEYVFHYVGITFMNDAKQNAAFTDQTGNLRASIGYSVLKDGKVIDEGFDGEQEGIAESKKVIKEIGKEYPIGYVLIGVAGMEYAAAVESKGYDVITGSTPSADILLTTLKKELNIL